MRRERTGTRRRPSTSRLAAPPRPGSVPAGRNLARLCRAFASRFPPARPSAVDALRARAGRERTDGAGARAPRPRRAAGGARRSSTPPRSTRRSASRGSATRSHEILEPRSGAASGSRSTATTTSTASARRRCSCGRCASSAPTSTPTSPTAPTATGCSLETVRRLAARGTRLLVTADCAITAVEEVRAARELGLAVVVTDHHSPRADGVLPDAPIVHPALCGYPCAELCATAVAYKLAQALVRSRRRGTRGAPARATSTSWRSRPSPTWCRCSARTARCCARGLRALAGDRQAGAARADGGRRGRPRAGRRARDRVRARRRA